MLRQRLYVFALCLLTIGILLQSGCKTKEAGSPQQVLTTYFTSAMKQDYATTYACYYAAYKEKVSEEDFIKHRKEASVLQNYKILSLKQDNATAEAEVLLTFAPSEKFKRTQPVDAKVKEVLVKENGNWKIKVW